MSFLEIVASWPLPNYADPVTRGDGIVIASVVFGVVGTIATALRVYTRIWITRTMGADDILIIFAWAWSIAMMVCLSIASQSYGFSIHIWDLPFEKMPTANKYSLVFQITFAFASSLTKLSLLWFCRRIIGDGRKISWGFHDIAIVVVMSIIVAFGVTYIILLLVQCRPLKALFDILPQYPHTCSVDSHMLTYGASIANTITDLLTTLIPVTLVATLHLPYRQRIAVMTIFLLGVFVNVAGAFRTYYVHRSMVITNLDRSWVGWPTCISAIVEIGLGLIVTSVPALRPFLNRYVPALLESSRRKYFFGKYFTPNTSERSGTSHKSGSGRGRRSRSLFPLSSIDKSWNKSWHKDSQVTSNITTADIEMREPPAAYSGHHFINVTRTVRQDSLHRTSWPKSPFSSRSQLGKEGRPQKSSERLNPVPDDEEKLTRLYESDASGNGPGR
ncbi:hypothetical protein BGW36DRAFT_457224 [Talaromyces proteolyticus]|uniref:Rhodopsin domain-containing protein n=1 Tax=Talaromyces proteolyticus TaxID=1131652 RepID=A0AAD4Q702_9EURO|nr:uncharacterized protein BGW36DRAFT_457224 [Talaromyces proteolyticus]KAH8705852.1 hypothetical protein BGW36DRAFT_457224 [Talaromyces proteolyticus]